MTWFGKAPSVCCMVAMYLRLWLGTTRSSWSAVTESTAGYCAPSPPVGARMLCSGETLYKVLQTGTVVALRSLSWYTGVADLMSDLVWDEVY